MDDADAAVVARLLGERTVGRERLLTFQVDQRVKGDVPRPVEVATPRQTSCDVPPLGEEAVGLLLDRRGGRFRASLCSLVPAGELVAAGGEPRGGPIKVAIGAVILLLVLAWSLRRLRRGARPDLPGAPRP
ncbi:MAG TPA: hypothetical protein VNJ46_00030 [Gaiellaceae bacterium]|nr:hypothetical protein [Gaiellaceae bacterium]